MRADNFETQKLVDYLQGSCFSLEQGLADLYPDMSLDDLTGEDHDDIDSQISMCETCNWWVEPCEICSETDNCGSNCTDCCEHEQ